MNKLRLVIPTVVAIVVAALVLAGCSTDTVQDTRASRLEARQDRMDSRTSARQDRWEERGAREDARARARFDAM